MDTTSPLLFSTNSPYIPLLEGREGLLPFSSIKLALWNFVAFFRSPFSFFQEKGAGEMSWFLSLAFSF